MTPTLHTALQPLLQVQNVSKSINNNLVLQNTSFDVLQNQKLAIAGETGSGKSTLLKIIGGLLQTDSGKVFFEGKKILGPDEQLLPGNKGIAYLSQHFELRNNYRIEELLAFNNQLSAEETDRICQICRINHLLKRRNDQISGGEKQRIATAKLLLEQPRLLLLDEPFTNLDAHNKQIMKKVLSEIGEALNTTIILISHDPTDTLPWADLMMIMHQGAVIQTDAVQQIYYNPVNEYAAGLLGNYQLLSQEQQIALSIIPSSSKRALIRPHYFQISLTSLPNYLKAKVVLQNFVGNFFIVMVEVAGLSIHIQTEEYIHQATIYIQTKQHLIGWL